MPLPGIPAITEPEVVRAAARRHSSGNRRPEKGPWQGDRHMGEGLGESGDVVGEATPRTKVLR